MAKNNDPEAKIKTISTEEAMRELLKGGTENLIMSDKINEFIKEQEKQDKNAIKLLKTNKDIREATKEILKSYIITFAQIEEDAEELKNELKEEYKINAPEFDRITNTINDEFINELPFMNYGDEDEITEKYNNALYELLKESKKELEEKAKEIKEERTA